MEFYILVCNTKSGRSKKLVNIEELQKYADELPNLSTFTVSIYDKSDEASCVLSDNSTPETIYSGDKFAITQMFKTPVRFTGILNRTELYQKYLLDRNHLPHLKSSTLLETFWDIAEVGVLKKLVERVNFLLGGSRFVVSNALFRRIIRGGMGKVYMVLGPEEKYHNNFLNILDYTDATSVNNFFQKIKRQRSVEDRIMSYMVSNNWKESEFYKNTQTESRIR